jgi:hypothetical protein
LIDPYSFDTGAPRMEHIDLRRDDTYYIYEIGPVDNYGNLDEGYNSYFGTFTYNRDGYGNTYIRVKHETYGTWRYKYELVNGELQFFYRTGEVGWRMRHLDDPTLAHVARIHEVFEVGTN